MVCLDQFIACVRNRIRIEIGPAAIAAAQHKMGIGIAGGLEDRRRALAVE